jgi:hypothetical protein
MMLHAVWRIAWNTLPGEYIWTWMRIGYHDQQFI